MKAVPFNNIDMLGFWGRRIELNRAVTLKAVYDRFKETGRFDAVNCNWKEGMPNRPHIFWDSDIAKWIEAAAYIIRLAPDKELEARIDETVDIIGNNQTEDGYFNSYYLTIEPENRFTVRDNHELYCAGHLTEAAIAYYEATGKDKFLKIMLRYIDLIEKVFKDEDSAGFCTPGHEEIELALVKLYECTGEKRYYELAKHFVEQRGRCDKDLNCRNWCGSDYDQSEVPVWEQVDAHGHSVRAAYLYCAMADLALRENDASMFKACRTIFESIAYRRMYVTGGIGSASRGEAFSADYDLPNEEAYSESCAAIALALFARRMSLIESDSLYADVAERALYNGILASTSLDGKSFFYEDPLEINLKYRETVRRYQNPDKHYPITQRVEVFGCSCCPPNILRFVASVGDSFYTYDDKAFYIHHYGESTADCDGIKVTQHTSYPNGGTVKISGAFCGRQVALRIPSWCSKWSVTLGGKALDVAPVKGYAYISAADGEEICLEMDMAPFFVYAAPSVVNNAGRVAVQRGPVIYCLEGVDNGNLPLNSLALTDNSVFTESFNEEANMYNLEAEGIHFIDGELYSRSAPKQEKTMLRFVPYYSFANRGETDMLVWARKI